MKEEGIFLETKRRRRGVFPIICGVLTSIATLFIMYLFRSEFLYYFAEDKSIDIGEAGTAIEWNKLKENLFVEATGIPWTTRALSYEKRLSLFGEKGRYSLFPLLGEEKLFVRYFKREGEKMDMLPGHFYGRLIKIKNLKGYSVIRQFYINSFGIDIPEDSWLILDGDTPHTYLWYFILYIILSLFLLINLIFVIKSIKKLKS